METLDKTNGNEQLQNGMRFMEMMLTKLLHQWDGINGNDGNEENKVHVAGTSDL